MCSLSLHCDCCIQTLNEIRLSNTEPEYNLLLKYLKNKSEYIPAIPKLQEVIAKEENEQK